jgi:hypothetical protein
MPPLAVFRARLSCEEAKKMPRRVRQGSSRGELYRLVAFTTMKTTFARGLGATNRSTDREPAAGTANLCSRVRSARREAATSRTRIGVPRTRPGISGTRPAKQLPLPRRDGPGPRFHEPGPRRREHQPRRAFTASRFHELLHEAVSVSLSASERSRGATQVRPEAGEVNRLTGSRRPGSKS